MLDPDDPNYQAYADGFEPDQQINYYVNLAENLKQEEKQTLYVDYQHMVNFHWEDQ